MWVQSRRLCRWQADALLNPPLKESWHEVQKSRTRMPLTGWLWHTVPAGQCGCLPAGRWSAVHLCPCGSTDGHVPVQVQAYASNSHVQGPEAPHLLPLQYRCGFGVLWTKLAGGIAHATVKGVCIPAIECVAVGFENSLRIQKHALWDGCSCAFGLVAL